MRLPSSFVPSAPGQEEDALAFAAAGFDALAEAVDEAFCIIEVLFDENDVAFDYRFVMVNEAFESQTGLENALGKRIRDLAPAHESHWYQIYGDVARTGKSVRSTHEARALNRWFEIKAIRVGDPARNHVGVLFRDITARMRAEDDLRIAEVQARLAVDIAQLGTFRFEPQSGLVKLDAQMRRLSGEPDDRGVMPVEEMQSRIHPEDRARVALAVAQATDPVMSLSNGGRYAVDYRITWPDGSEHWIAANGQAEFQGEGAGRLAVRVVGTILDITGRKQAEAMLRDSDARKDEFLATLAHELRNPLSTIRNTLRLQGMPPTGAEAERVRTMLERQVNHMVHLIDDLMEISRISHGTIELDQRALDLATVVQDAVEAARPGAERACHALDVDVCGEALPVVGDAVRLGQVLTNLLANAIRYTDPGGRIAVHASRDEAHVNVAVTDSGIGIAPEKLSGLFALFGQIDRSDPRSQGGLGIGLALSRRLAQMHGGEVSASSAGLGKGCTFVMQLPLERPSASVGQAVAGDSVRRQGGSGDGDDGKEGGGESTDTAGRAQPTTSDRLLVVDDNKDAADSTALLLSMLGVETRVAYGGTEALSMLEEAMPQWKPDMVLLDLGMPGMDGYEVARHIRSVAAYAGLTLVALTGWGQDADIRRTREAGFDHHLVKPMDVDALMALLASVRRGPA